MEKTIRFITPEYNELFCLPEGEKLTILFADGHEEDADVQSFSSDGYHIAIGGRTYHICEFAELCERIGAIVRPAGTELTDGPDFFEIYQLKDVINCPYAFDYFEEEQVKAEDYQRVYGGYLTGLDENSFSSEEEIPVKILQEIFLKHNAETRPGKNVMRAMSASDILTVKYHRHLYTYYVNPIGFRLLLGPRGAVKEV